MQVVCIMTSLVVNLELILEPVTTCDLTLKLKDCQQSHQQSLCYFFNPHTLNPIVNHLRSLIPPLIPVHSCSRNPTIPPLTIFSRIRDGPPTSKGPGSGSGRTGAPGRGSERGTAGGPPGRSGVGVGMKAWADPSQMVVWLPGKKKKKKHLVQ